MSRSRSGRMRRMAKESMAESDDSEAGRDDDDDEDEEVVRSTRRTSRKLASNSLGGFVAADDEDDEDDEGEYGSRKTRSGRVLRRGNSSSSNRLQEMAAKKRAANGRGRHAKKVIDDEFEMDGDDTPEEDHISGAEEPEGSQGQVVLAPPAQKGQLLARASSSLAPKTASAVPSATTAAVPPMAPTKSIPRLPVLLQARHRCGSAECPSWSGKKGKEGWDALPSSMTAKDYARIFGDPVDSSDDELQNNALRQTWRVPRPSAAVVPEACWRRWCRRRGRSTRRTHRLGRHR
ncbi:hypothetical protein L1887_43282 [Cichorium endivia]|nr:hypothetical protein L1887_43282 [Cichorium endivia]